MIGILVVSYSVILPNSILHYLIYIVELFYFFEGAIFMLELAPPSIQAVSNLPLVEALACATLIQLVTRNIISELDVDRTVCILAPLSILAPTSPL